MSVEEVSCQGSGVIFPASAGAAVCKDRLCGEKTSHGSTESRPTGNATADQVAGFLGSGVTARHVMREYRKGRLAGFRIGRVTYFLPESVAEWMYEEIEGGDAAPPYRDAHERGLWIRRKAEEFKAFLAGCFHPGNEAAAVLAGRLEVIENRLGAVEAAQRQATGDAAILKQRRAA